MKTMTLRSFFNPSATTQFKFSKLSKAGQSYLILAVISLAAIAGFAGYGWVTRNQVSTDNAQVEVNIVPLAAKVGGTIDHVYVKDNQSVKKGDLIAEIDPRGYQIQVAEAEAELEAALAQADRLIPTTDKKQNIAQVMVAEAQLKRATIELRKTDSDLQRAQELRKQKAITQVELENSQNAAAKARAALTQAKAQLRIAEEMHGVAAAKVKAATARLQEAQLRLDYTKIVAVQDGIMSKIAVEEGQLVQPGQLIVQLAGNTPYIIANFKETQIASMQPGQEAEIEIDAFPDQKLIGKVTSLSPATGARFSLIPADNASGNFVKVVQRVPVMIDFSEQSKNEAHLIAGLSAEVTVYLK